MSPAGAEGPPGAAPAWVRVLPATGSLDKEFDYAVPAGFGPSRPLVVGDRVRVPLGARKVAGWVSATPAGAAPGGLKELAGWRGLGPSPELVELAAWASWRWAGPRRLFLEAASPHRIVRELQRRAGPRGESPLPSWAPGSLGEPWDARSGVIRLAPAADRLPIIVAVLAASGGQVLILVPSEAGAAVLARRLAQRGEDVALLPGAWAAAAAGARVVVGSRSAAWAPAPWLEAVVVLDCHDEVWKETRNPTWDAVELTMQRCRRSGARWLGLSCCPPLSLSHKAPVFHTSRAEERQGWASIEVVDMASEDPRHGLVSARLARLARSAERSSPLLVVYNRKGRARLLACSRCAALARCERCGAALSSATGPEGEILACGRCSSSRPLLCGSCGSTRLAVLRPGVSRLTEQLALLGVEVAEDAGGSDAVAVSVGTEGLLHRGLKASVVVMADFDQELLRPHFAAPEAALALLGRASRSVGGRAGRVVVQTRLASHPVIQAALHADPGRLGEVEEPLRRELGLPPFSALAVVSGSHAGDWLEGLRSPRQAFGDRVELSGPEGDRWLLRAPDTAVLCDTLAALGRRPPRVRVEVDPLRA